MHFNSEFFGYEPVLAVLCDIIPFSKYLGI